MLTCYVEATPFMQVKSQGLSPFMVPQMQRMWMGLYGAHKGHAVVDILKKDGTLLDSIVLKMKDFDLVCLTLVISAVNGGDDYAWNAQTKTLTIKTGEYVSFEVAISGNYERIDFEYDAGFEKSTFVDLSGSGMARVFLSGVVA